MKGDTHFLWILHFYIFDHEYDINLTFHYINMCYLMCSFLPFFLLSFHVCVCRWWDPGSYILGKWFTTCYNSNFVFHFFKIFDTISQLSRPILNIFLILLSSFDYACATTPSGMPEYLFVLCLWDSFNLLFVRSSFFLLYKI